MQMGLWQIFISSFSNAYAAMAKNSNVYTLCSSEQVCYDPSQRDETRGDRAGGQPLFGSFAAVFFVGSTYINEVFF